MRPTRPFAAPQATCLRTARIDAIIGVTGLSGIIFSAVTSTSRNASAWSGSAYTVPLFGVVTITTFPTLMRPAASPAASGQAQAAQREPPR